MASNPTASEVVVNLPGRELSPVTIRVVAGELHKTATEGEGALIHAAAPLYVRGGIVRPVVDAVPAAHGHLTQIPRLVSVDADLLVDWLSRSACWEKFNQRKNDFVPTDPPRAVAATILARDGEWRLRKLTGITTTPTIRADGTLVVEPGYDPQTSLLLLDPPELPPIPERPTREQALSALKQLDDLLEEFPFVDAASRSVALSALITPVVRGALPVAPMHVASAPVPGSGKSFIVDLASAILTGDRAPVLTTGRTEEETEKRLGAALLAGMPIVSIDNVNGHLKGDLLCQLIERPIISVRPLGVSKQVRIESRATTFATGNNIQLVGDMTRRAIMCSLDPNTERPELREFRGNPFEAVLCNRGKYIAAALTVCRAYIIADCPGELPPLASFEAWSRTVRSALVWLGRDDPLKTMEAARAEDPELSRLTHVLHAWHAAVGEAPRLAGSMKEMAEQRDNCGNSFAYDDLHLALLEVAEGKRGGIDTKKLGSYCARNRGRIVDGLKLASIEDTHNKQQAWKVVRTSAGSAGNGW